MSFMRQPPTRIVVLGGGFGGAYCAQALERRLRRGDAEILLIDRNNYFVFYPLLVEAGTGSLEPRHAVVSIRAFLKRAQFCMGEVAAIDPVAQRIAIVRPGEAQPEHVPYDKLVISLGSVTNYPRVPGLHEHAFTIKSIADAVALRDHGIRLLELADTCDDASKRRALLHLVVVGGNFTGVEAAGELSTFLREACRSFRRVRTTDIRVTLIEISDRILRPLGDELGEYAVEAMSRCGIETVFNDSVTEIGANRVVLKSGRVLETQTTVWCAGIAPNPALAATPFPKDARGYVLTERDMRIPGFPNVWAIGDCAVNPGPDGSAYPATAQHAVRQGAHAAGDIARVLRGLPTRPTRIADLGAIAGIGCRTGVAKLLGVRVSGFAAWWLYRTVYLMKMPGLARKLRLAIDWTMDLLFPRDYVQLSVHRRTGDNDGD